MSSNTTEKHLGPPSQGTIDLIMKSVTTTSSAANRRSAQRRTPRANVSLELRRGNMGLGNNLAVLFLDLSEGGVRIVVNEEFECHDVVEVQMTAYGMKKPLKVTGEVRWAMQLDNGMYCLGVQFSKRLSYRDVTPLFKP
jgi:hypothetical protein